MALKTFIANATIIKTFASIAILAIYSLWLFGIDENFTAAMTAAGQLPETVPGFHDNLPAAALTQLGGEKNGYITFQFLDLPYALLNTLALAMMISVGLKALNAHSTIFRFILVFPGIYLGAEIIEDVLLVAMTTGTFAMTGLAVTAQQSATIIKFSSIAVSAPVALIGLLFALGSALRSLLKNGNS